MTHPTIENVLATCWQWGPGILAENIKDATTNGPIRSADGTLVIHRADPELAAELLEEARVAEGWCEDMESPEVRRLADLLRRAAALLAGDPADEGKAK